MRVMSVCAKVDGALPGMWDGVLPVDNSTLGTSKRGPSTSSPSSASSASCSLSPSAVKTGFACVPGMSSSFSISARTPHTTLVLPNRTTADPLQCVKLPVFMPGVRNSCAVRPLARKVLLILSAERCAWRNGCGETAANIGRGKVSAGGGADAVVAIVDDSSCRVVLRRELIEFAGVLEMELWNFWSLGSALSLSLILAGHRDHQNEATIQQASS